MSTSAFKISRIIITDSKVYYKDFFPLFMHASHPCNRLLGVVIGWTDVSSGTGH